MVMEARSGMPTDWMVLQRFVKSLSGTDERLLRELVAQPDANRQVIWWCDGEQHPAQDLDRSE